MPIPLEGSLPPGVEVSDGYVIRVTAIDPTTGNTVAGVTVSNVTITGSDLSGGPGGGRLDKLPPVLEYASES